MKEWEDVKQIYDNIEIPAELDDVVQKAVSQTVKGKKGHSKMKNSWLKKSLGVVAAAALLFTVGVNSNEAFAQDMQNIPVLGSIAKVVTFRSYMDGDADKVIKVNIPEIKTDHADAFVAEINTEIKKICEQYATYVENDIAEYKNAFLETGGTEDAFAAKGIVADINYEIKNQGEEYVSFVVYVTENWISNVPQAHYYNLDLQKDRYLTLADLLGNDYITICNDSITKQMQQRLDKEQYLSYFAAEDGGFTSVDENTKFYINSKGNPVIVFDKYEIAPGAFGVQEFEIAK